jgi:sarcosine oxidase
VTRSDAEVIVVGLGVNGAAAARALAARGRDVIALERQEPGHDGGSSHGTSRIFRLAYADSRYVADARAALDLWRALETESGDRLLHTVGSLDIGPASVEIARVLAAQQVDHELLDGADASSRWPLAATAGEPVLHQPDGAVTLADRALSALVRSARLHGAHVLERTEAVTMHAADGHVAVETARGTIRASVAVVAAGAWTRALLAPSSVDDLPLVPTRETVAFFRLHDRLHDAEALPTVIDWSAPTDGEPGLRDGAVPYALAAPGVGLKVGLHHAGPATDPDRQGEISDAALARAASWVARRCPAADPAPLSAETCIYTTTPDESFLLARHGRLVVASACSGHGFKFAPLTGERVATLAEEALASG